jgi:hypothetical protein
MLFHVLDRRANRNSNAASIDNVGRPGVGLCHARTTKISAGRFVYHVLNRSVA